MSYKSEEDPEVEFLVLPEKKTRKTEPDSSDAQEENRTLPPKNGVESSDTEPGAAFNLRQK